jgi:hypothetical protein
MLHNGCKTRTVECVEVATARQRHAKHKYATTDIYITTEELLETVFSMRSMQRVYKENQLRMREHGSRRISTLGNWHLAKTS